MKKALVWQRLFGHALVLIDDALALGNSNLHWTFGGGTVLMLRHQHRLSKDIDIFVPDPQPLGFFTPRLSSYAEEISGRYVETAGFVKLFLPEGEIDFVASPHLTSNPFEVSEIAGRAVKLETSAEIIAKKFWHRGDRLTARDIFDFAAIAEMEPKALEQAQPFIARHREIMLELLKTHAHPLRLQFEAIDFLDYSPSYEHASSLLLRHLS
jgi:predicted nucleotidyltransferase component of viral defense system